MQYFYCIVFCDYIHESIYQQILHTQSSTAAPDYDNYDYDYDYDDDDDNIGVVFSVLKKYPFSEQVLQQIRQ